LIIRVSLAVHQTEQKSDAGEAALGKIPVSPRKRENEKKIINSPSAGEREKSGAGAKLFSGSIAR
jgi:hypothetical protein